MKFYSAKIINCKTADIHLHYANNRGRGSDNVTITIVLPGTPRAKMSRGYSPDQIIKQYRVSGWAGHVNVPTGDINLFGGVI